MEYIRTFEITKEHLLLEKEYLETTRYGKTFIRSRCACVLNINNTTLEQYLEIEYYLETMELYLEIVDQRKSKGMTKPPLGTYQSLNMGEWTWVGPTSEDAISKPQKASGEPKPPQVENCSPSGIRPLEFGNINRFEVIDHTTGAEDIRPFYKRFTLGAFNILLSLEDKDKILKIFLHDQ